MKSKEIVLLYGEKVVGELDNLKNRMGIESMGELFRLAVSLLDLTDDKIREGYSMEFRKEGIVLEVELPPVIGGTGK